MADCEGMILPGVGAFPMAMQALDRLELRSLLMDFVVQERPLMGVCLGMQLLFSGSEELGGAEGLGIIDGTVRQLRPGDGKLPHIGWTPVSWTRSSLLNERLPEAAAMYHVHSYVCEPSEPDATLATAVHGETFTTAVSSGSVYGVQFHPEKSSDDGLHLIRNFVAICSGRR
jgi:glutamine amidotransferase